MKSQTIDYIREELNFLMQLNQFIYENLNPKDAMKVRNLLFKRVEVIDKLVK